VYWAKEFTELAKNLHDRDSFDCGEPELNSFIQTKATKHMEIGISRTWVLPGSVALSNGKYQICSFYTIVPGSIDRNDFPDKLAKKLPFYPVPVFLLAQLAVHSDYHGKGLGKITLSKALQFSFEINLFMKAFAVVVDCLNENAKNFYLKYDFQELVQHEGRIRMFLPMKTIEELFKT
jgi:GNAT superfamily N-acetyltransferase